jgi:hypothetical protein
MIASMLETDGHQVLAARGEKEAAPFAAKAPVDLILAGIYNSESEAIAEAKSIRFEQRDWPRVRSRGRR